MTPQSARSQRSGRNHLAGYAAENRIAQDYERRGFSVARQRWRSPAGEIDLILEQGDTLVFVEVKQSRSHATAAGRLSERQMARIYDAGACFLSEIGASMDTDVRFDVALVDGIGQYEIIENAFGL